MTTRTRARALVFCAAATLALATAGVHQAEASGVLTYNPGLPPQDAIGGYAGYSSQYHTMYDLPGGGNITLTNVDHYGFSDITVTTVGANEFESFNSSLTGLVSVLNGPQDVPFLLTGPVSVEAFGKAGLTTGTFATQMLSMDMTGTVLGQSAEIMLNPNVASPGSTTIADLGGAPPLYGITSFFDVFTEISLNGGTFVPAAGGAVVTLGTVPEPSALVMGAIAATVGLGYAGSRRRRAS